jgi:hypothetical protein
MADGFRFPLLVIRTASLILRAGPESCDKNVRSSVDGSRAEIHHPVRVGSGTCHKWVIHQVVNPAPLFSAVGQELSSANFLISCSESKSSLYSGHGSN